MTKLESVERKIRELVPSSMELSFGCRFLDSRYVPRELVYLSKFTGKKCVAFWEQAGYGEAMSAEVVKIIGHPITLEDVLEAYAAIIYNDTSTLTKTADHQMMQVISRWHFGKLFSEQTELINWLYELFNLSE